MSVSVAAGMLTVTAPSAPVTGSSVSVPEVALPIVREPSVPEAPSVGVAVKAPVAPFGTSPAVPARVVALMAVLQLIPVLVVQISASVASEQDGTDCAVGDPVPLVALTRMVFAACVARSARVTRPVAVIDPVNVGEAMVGEVASAALPLPVVAMFPRTPPLFDSRYPLVPSNTVVTATVIDAAVDDGEHEPPNVQTVELTVIVSFARSAFVTSPVAVNDPVTVKPARVPTLVSDDPVTPEARVAPVSVPAAAGTVQVDPSVHTCPLTVVAELTRSAFVTKPVAVSDPVTVSPAIVPRLVIFPCTAAGNVELIEGTPAPLVIRTPLLAVERHARVFPELAKYPI